MRSTSGRAWFRRVRLLFALVVGLTVSIALWWTRDVPPPAPVVIAEEKTSVVAGVAEPDSDEPGVPAEDSIPPEEARRELENASREAFARRAPGTRIVTGVTRAADTGWPVSCSVVAIDEAGESCRVQRAAGIAGGFVVTVDSTARRLAFTSRHRLDLETASVDLPMSGDVTDLDVALVRARGTIGGHVIDERGMPIAGVRVALNGERAFRTTGPGGTFRFGPLRDDPYWLSVPTPAFSTRPAENSQTVRVIDGRQIESVMFVVVRGATLRGKVVAAESGSPIEGVRIVLAQSTSSSDHRNEVSDRDGAFEFLRLVAGSYQLTATDENGSRARQQVLIESLGDEVRTIVVEMAAGAGNLAGRLVDTAGDAVPFAEVVVRKPDAAADERSWTTRSDSRGRFRFAAIPAGAWWVGLDPAYCEVHNWLADAGTSVVVRDGADAETEIELHAGAFLTGQVVSESKRRNLIIRLRKDEDVREERVGSDGHFAFGGIRSGQYLIEALAADDPAVSLGQQVVFVQVGEDSSIQLRVP